MRMTISTTTRLSALLCAVTLFAPVATPFGDNDGGLDLPTTHGAGAGGSGESSNNMSEGASGGEPTSIGDAPVLVFGQGGIDEGLREDAGTLRFEDAILGEQGDLGGDEPTNDLQLGGDDAAASQDASGVAIQGSLTVPAELVGSASLLPPSLSAANAALIVVDSDPDASLDELLAGQVALDSWHLTGVPTALDVGRFADLATQLGPGVQVTFLVASLDLQGGLHLSGVRVDTSDGQVEFATH